MTHPELIHSLYQIGAIKFGEFTLKSGQASKIYLDLRLIVSYPDILKAVADAMWAKISIQHFDILCGVPYTALPIATAISLFHQIPMIMRRKEKKTYGTKQQIEGKYHAGQRCLIIEDVITSGSSILETAEDLEAAGLKIHDVAVLIDREVSGQVNLRQKKYQLHAIFTLQTILEVLSHSNLLTTIEYDLVNALLHEKI